MLYFSCNQRKIKRALVPWNPSDLLNAPPPERLQELCLIKALCCSFSVVGSASRKSTLTFWSCCFFRLSLLLTFSCDSWGSLGIPLTASLMKTFKPSEVSLQNVLTAALASAVNGRCLSVQCVAFPLVVVYKEGRLQGYIDLQPLDPSESLINALLKPHGSGRSITELFMRNISWHRKSHNFNPDGVNFSRDAHQKIIMEPLGKDLLGPARSGTLWTGPVSGDPTEARANGGCPLSWS